MQCSAGRSRFFIKPCKTDLTDGRWTNCNTNRWDYRGREKKEKSHLQNGIIIRLVFLEDKIITHTTAGCYSDLYSVPSWLAHVFQIQGLVRGLVVTSFDA